MTWRKGQILAISSHSLRTYTNVSLCTSTVLYCTVSDLWVCVGSFIASWLDRSKALMFVYVSGNAAQELYRYEWDNSSYTHKPYIY